MAEARQRRDEERWWLIYTCSQCAASCKSIRLPGNAGRLQGSKNKLQAAVLGRTNYRGLGDDGKLFIQVRRSVVVKRI